MVKEGRSATKRWEKKKYNIKTIQRFQGRGFGNAWDLCGPYRVIWEGGDEKSRRRTLEHSQPI
jgi:hypothetical protein